MNIGIDIDDTISNTYEYLFPYAQKYTIEDLNREINIVNRNSTTHMYATTFHNWNKEEEIMFFTKYYKKIVRQAKPKMYAVDIINKLRSQGHRIYLVTARFNIGKINIEAETIKWLKENKIQYDELIIDAVDKVEIAKSKDIDIFIDDSISNCIELWKNGIKAYMMDTIINLNFEDKKIERVYSWPHLYQKIIKLKEEI